MNLKKHSFALVTGFLFLVATGGVGFWLYTSRGEFLAAKEKLSQAENKFKQLSGGSPYPSDENVLVEKQNLERLAEFYSELEAYLCAGQLKPVPMESAEFPERLEELYTSLRESATNRSVRLPVDFYFGFEAYVDQLPAAEDVPRLTVQAQVVEQLCNVLFDNKVSSIESVTREVFETNLASGGSRYGRGGGMMGDEFGFENYGGGVEDVTETLVVEEESGLYTTEHIEILFSARDEQVWNALNALGSNKLFAVVTSIEIESTGSGLGSGSELGSRRSSRSSARSSNYFGDDEFGSMVDEFGGGGFNNLRRSRRPSFGSDGGRGSPEQIVTHEDRLVAGREERATVLLGVDVYRFCLEEPEEEALLEDSQDGGEEGSEEEVFL